MTDTIKVALIGPNLPGAQAYHVHAIDCADRKKPVYRGAERQNDWSIPFAAASREEVAYYLYADHMEPEENGGSGLTMAEALRDVKFFPCAVFPADTVPAKRSRKLTVVEETGDAMPAAIAKALAPISAPAKRSRKPKLEPEAVPAKRSAKPAAKVEATPEPVAPARSRRPRGTSKDAVPAKLSDIRDALAELDAARETLVASRNAAILAALEAGVPGPKIAAELGMTPPAIYRIRSISEV